MNAAGYGQQAALAPAADNDLVQALRAGCEDTFASILNRYHAPMMRVASMYVSSRAAAEDVVQEAWLGVLQGINRFEERCSLKTWIFRILVNRAKTRAQREGRSIPFSAMGDGEESAPAVDPHRFLPPDHPREPRHWAHPPRNWDDSPEERLLSQETRARVRSAIEGLPPTQREVITLRDIEGWTSEEVCGALRITDANQRVLLHRARSKVRRALEEFLDPH